MNSDQLAAHIAEWVSARRGGGLVRWLQQEHDAFPFGHADNCECGRCEALCKRVEDAAVDLGWWGGYRTTNPMCGHWRFRCYDREYGTVIHSYCSIMDRHHQRPVPVTVRELDRV